VDEALYRQIGAASHSQALVFVGDFNHWISVGKTRQRGMSNAGGFWTTLMITSFSK